MFDIRRPVTRRSRRSSSVMAVLLATSSLAGCFSGTNLSDSATTQGTLSTVPISIANPADTLTDAIVDVVPPAASDATEPAVDAGTCSVRLDVRPLAESPTTDSTPAADDEPITWTGNSESSGFSYGGWISDDEVAAIEAEGLSVDRTEFNLSCIGGGGRTISLVGTNLIPMKPTDYPLRLSPTGGQSTRDKVLLNVSTVSTDVTDPRISVWALAEATTLRITEFDETAVRATIEASLVSVESGRSATLRADFEFSRG